VVVTARTAPVRRCTWRDCTQPAAATVRFELPNPNLLAGSRRDYRAAHTMKVCMARGTVLVARFGPSQPTLPGLRDAASTGRPARQGTRSTRRRKMTCTGTPSGSSTDDRAEGLLAELEGGPDGDHRRA